MDKIDFDNIGPHEEITNRLRSLLDGYKDGLSIFKEMIQNADDAKASVVKICYDQHSSKTLFDPELPHKQGHAIFFYNDSEFQKHDFKNIAKLGAGTKSNNPEKIGQFGLGFTSVYNITDNPTVISGSKFMIFDPAVNMLKKHISDSRNPGILIDFADPKYDFDDPKFTDAFLPYREIFDCNITKDYKYPGTLIRLPFRKTPSKISDNIYSSESDIVNLFEILFQNADSLLLFTQSVKKIEFYILRENMTVMEPVYNFDVSIEKLLRGHGIALGGCDRDDQNLAKLQAESSLLRAAVESILNDNITDLESALIVKSKTKINQESNFFNDYKSLFKTCATESTETYWLIVSTFFKAHLKDGDNFKKFVPCVGMALSVEKIKDEHFQICNYDPKLFEGSIFCFLPLAIENSFTFHLNCTFQLTEDRTRIFERTRDDRSTNPKHEWNEYLVKPIVDNLLKMFSHVSGQIGMSRPMTAIKWLYPIDNENVYFKKIETEFYQRICSSISKELAFPSYDHFHPYKDCIFVDFEFNDQKLQETAIRFVTRIFSENKTAPKHLIELPLNYLAKIKDMESASNKFLDELGFLTLLINHKTSIQILDYQQLIVYFLRKSVTDTANNSQAANLIRTNESILSSNHTFKIPSKLIDKNSNKHFTCLYEESDDCFINDYYYTDDLAISALVKLGMITKTLPDTFILNIAEKIRKLQSPVVAKQLSANLLKYCESDKISDTLKKQLSEIEWVWSKTKPENWHLAWDNDKVSQLCKPVQLLSDEFEKYAGCVEPLLERSYCDLLQVKPWSNQLLVEASIRQLTYMSKLTNLHSNQVDQIDQLFKAFVEIVRNPCAELYKKFPRNWIYCRDSGGVFLDNQSLAMSVENAVFPEIYELPRVYQDDALTRKFFISAGIPEKFSIGSLKEKLSQLQKKHANEPLDGHSKKLCSNIISEMLISDQPEELMNLKKEDDFYLPDTDYILRKGKHFCSELTGRESDSEIYLLHESIISNSKCFGIEDSRTMICESMGEPFGQKEELSNRIRAILKGYDTQAHIFTEMIQNADDAGAKEIRFIIDWRELDTKKVFGKSYEPLQGPALCSWNDSIFTEADYTGIKSLGKGSKETNLSKTGRFGVGVNTQFHITDAIQFISDEDKYVIFDPLCKHYPSANLANPGRRLDLKKHLKGMYSDVLTGFNFMPLKGSTMFRLALRSQKPSDESNCLSKEIFSVSQMKQMMLDFASKAYETLFFLQSIRKISFYELDKNNNLQELKTHRVTFESNSDEKKLTDFWDAYRIQIAKDYKFKQINYRKIMMDFNIESKNTSLSTEIKRFHVSQQFGFEDSVVSHSWKEIDTLENNKGDKKFFPLAGIAFELNNQKSISKYKLYNILPLHQESPIACHVNGYFALHQENRTQLFVNSERSISNKIDTNTAVWSTNWNTALISLIVLPLYIDSIKFRTDHMLASCDNEQPDQLIKNFWHCFPRQYHITKELKEYFKLFTLEFYKRACDIECIPIYCVNENSIKVFKPSQLLFSDKIDDFLKRSACTPKETNEICSSISTVVKEYCKHTKVVSLFKSHDIVLNQLDTKGFLHKLKAYCQHILGMNVNDTIFKSVKNVVTLLKFCIEDQRKIWTQLPESSKFLFLDKIPLMITSDNIIREFSTTEKIFHMKYRYITCFEKMKGAKILHPDLLKIPELKQDLPFFKKFTITNLDQCLNVIFGPEKKLATGDPYTEECAKEIKATLSLIWQFIIESIVEQDSNNANFTRITKIELLAPIKDWALLPVSTTSDVNMSSVKLAPIRDIKKILTKNLNFPLKTKDLLMQFSVIKVNFFDTSFEPVFQNMFKEVAMDPSRASDFVILLQHISTDKLSEHNRDILTTLEDFTRQTNYNHNKKAYEVTMLNCDAKMNLKSENELKAIIRKRPIFESFTSKDLICLDSKVVRAIRADYKNFVISYFDKYCQAKSIVLIKQEPIFGKRKLTTYLDIGCISLEKFYEDFLSWSLTGNRDPKEMKKHMEILKEMYNKDRSGFNEAFKAILAKTAFIEIKKTAFKPSDLCDRSDSLFMAGFRDRLLPDEFYEDNWLPFLKFLGLKVVPIADDILKLATIFKQQFESRFIDLLELENLAKLIINQLNLPYCTPIFDQIKTVEFIPSYFCNRSTIHQKVYNPVVLKKPNVCFQNAFHKDSMDFVWTKNAILPDYCEKLKLKKPLDTKESPTCTLIIDNFEEITRRCSKESFLQSLNQEEKQDLKALFLKYYGMLQTKLSASEDNKTQICRLAVLNCIWNERAEMIHLDKASCFYRNISPEEFVPPYILKFPSSYVKYSVLMNLLGVREGVEFGVCVSALTDLYNRRSTLSHDCLLDNVLSLYKFFIYDKILCEDSPSIQLYAPSLDGSMHRLEDLYYDDDDPEILDYIRNKSANNLNVIFDIEKLKNKYFKINGNLVQNDLNLTRAAICNEMNSWDKIFQTLPYFIKHPDKAAKPLSSLIERRMANEDLNLETDIKLNTILRSVSFADLVKSNLHECFDCQLSEPGCFIEIFESFSIKLKEEITTSYIYRKSKEPVDLEEQSHEFLITKATRNGKIHKQIYFVKKFSLRNRIFYLTEILFDEILNASNLNLQKLSKTSQWCFKCKINEYFETECNI